MQILDISGEWRFETDEQDIGIRDKFFQRRLEGEGFCLPGSACENGVGIKQDFYTEFSKEAVRAPRERYEYIGALWLQKDICVPKEAEGKAIRLFLERVNVASQLWIDGEQIGRQIVELSAPHVYKLTGKLQPGVHTLTIRVDNRNLIHMCDMASGYSVDTQGYWNGIIGRMELQWEEILHVENVQIFPGDMGILVRYTHTSDVHSPFPNPPRPIVRTEFTVITPDGKRLGKKSHRSELYNSRQREEVYYSLEEEKLEYWDEFHPALYHLEMSTSLELSGDSAASANDSSPVDSAAVSSFPFGMRQIRVENKQFLLNQRKISLRGTTDCAINPLTGYPPMDKETWRQRFALIKSYGLNHVRFHAWCPPENAFQAADELGIYLSVEMPLWLNRDVCEIEFGEDPIHSEYYRKEALEISKTYGNHPSFLLFSNGNENMGDFELLEEITIQTKAYDNRRLYTLTSNFDHPIRPCEDYLCAYEAYGNKIRIQDLQDDVAKNTCFQYNKAVEDVPVPIISFEVGQYCVYPNVDLTKQYTGNMMAVNLDIIGKHMHSCGVYHRLREYIKASGALAVKLYKEDIECALRTKGFGGIELLSLCDYTGQSTATVGLLDVFYQDKGFITPEMFRQFCGPVVPLFQVKRILTNEEVLHAELSLYDFGESPIENPLFRLAIYRGEQLWFEEETYKTEITIPLGSITKSAMLQVQLSVGAYCNSWKLFVMQEVIEYPAVTEAVTAEELKQVIKQGGKAIVKAEHLKEPISTDFIPVFWSPVHFPTARHCGAMIDAAHPVFNSFPTESVSDYQWKNLLEHGKGFNLTKFPEECKPMVELVPNFVDNIPCAPLLEVCVGKSKLLLCGFDLEESIPEAANLKKSIYEYMISEDFQPKCEMEESKLLELFETIS